MKSRASTLRSDDLGRPYIIRIAVLIRRRPNLAAVRAGRINRTNLKLHSLGCFRKKNRNTKRNSLRAFGSHRESPGMSIKYVSLHHSRIHTGRHQYVQDQAHPLTPPQLGDALALLNPTLHTSTKRADTLHLLAADIFYMLNAFALPW